MRINWLTGTLAAIVAFGSAISPGSAQPLNAGISTSTDFAWRTLTQAACVERAVATINAAMAQFPLTGMTIREDVWYVVGEGPDTDIWIDCVADDDTNNVVNAQVDRMLVIVIVNSLRADFAPGIRDFVGDCMGSGTCGGGPGKLAGNTLTWDDGAVRYRGRNGERIELVCPPVGNAAMGAVWGTDIYSDDSAICVAAVHAGAITTAGGNVTIEILPGQNNYAGSSRNGVTTFAWSDPHPGSYRVISTGGAK